MNELLYANIFAFKRRISFNVYCLEVSNALFLILLNQCDTPRYLRGWQVLNECRQREHVVKML